MSSAIAATYNLRPEQKLQVHTEYPRQISSHLPELIQAQIVFPVWSRNSISLKTRDIITLCSKGHTYVTR
jgi:hypothetical protein